MSFPHFSQLPCELRLEIWSYALVNESAERLCMTRDSRFSLHISEISYHPSPLLATDREARHEAQSCYAVKIEIIDLRVARTIVDKWFPGIPAGSVSGKEYGYMCYRFLEKIPRQLQQLVIGCVYLSPVHVRQLEEAHYETEDWYFRIIDPHRASPDQVLMLHGTVSLPAKVLDRLLTVVAGRFKHRLQRDFSWEIVRRVIDIPNPSQSQVSDRHKRPEPLWEMLGDRHWMMDGDATRESKAPRTQSRGQRRAMKVQRKAQRFARLQ
ncbi:hypothetical protein PG985_000870 [Apiospora marii]|uniref:2EXR domain-containing protein n=1 Tax=Apiospora marii TaxID=335849 RepID=A0ABR1RGC5_9PEZI